MLFQSPSSLSEEARVKACALLQPVVLNLLALAGVARKAHWNVRGMLFAELHELFGNVYNAANEQADIIAEHMAMLGSPVNGDHIDVAEGSSLTRMPATIVQGRDLAKAVGDRLSSTLQVVNMPKGELLALGDEDAQQKLLDASMALSKLGWMLLAHVS